MLLLWNKDLEAICSGQPLTQSKGIKNKSLNIVSNIMSRNNLKKKIAISLKTLNFLSWKTAFFWSLPKNLIKVLLYQRLNVKLWLESWPILPSSRRKVGITMKPWEDIFSPRKTKIQQMTNRPFNLHWFSWSTLTDPVSHKKIKPFVLI